jgi:hypothetical protein
MMRQMTIVALAVGGIVLALLLTKGVERLFDGLMLRVGSVWTLGILVAATVVLAAMWLRYGGTRVARGWGIVVKPARPRGDEASVGSQRRPPLVGPRQ